MKKRLDVAMVERGLADSRTRAQALVLAGKVRVLGQVETRASRQIDDGAEVSVESPPRFVSRGGDKLEGAFALWGGDPVRPLDVRGLDCLDVGSSTGGFTDCLLQHGAAFVMAVDVGTNQLAYGLRIDPRVWVRENFNARFMTPEDLPRMPRVAVTDVSFISLKLILPPLKACLKRSGQVVALIKPQFEAGRGQVGKNGVVREESIHRDVCINIIRYAQEAGYRVEDLSFSPITGPKGNIEFLLFLRNGVEADPAEPMDFEEKVAQIVSDGHKFHINC